MLPHHTTCQSSAPCGVGDSRTGYSQSLMAVPLSSVSDRAPREPDPSVQGLRAGPSYCSFHSWILLIIHIPSTSQGCVSTKPTCPSPVVSILFPPECSQGRLPCIYSCVYAGTIFPETRTQFTSSMGLCAIVDGDLVCAPDSLYYSGETCRGPHLSIDAGTEVRLLVGILLSHTVFATSPFCAHAP